jgi:hypothetical protein
MLSDTDGDAWTGVMYPLNTMRIVAASNKMSCSRDLLEAVSDPRYPSLSTRSIHQQCAKK